MIPFKVNEFVGFADPTADRRVSCIGGVVVSRDVVLNDKVISFMLSTTDTVSSCCSIAN
jgi:hypothetical protein